MNKKPVKIMVFIGIIVGALLLGLIVYTVVSGLIGKAEPPANKEFIGEEIALSDENVKVLYDYVTFGAEGDRNLKFVTEQEVNMASFSEKEKLYYALMFAQVEDFEFTGERNTSKQKIYTIPIKTITNYMKLFFGPSVTYQPEKQMSFPFTFSINRMNVGKMTYNQKRDGYDTVFDSQYDPEQSKSLVPPVYGKLISALRKPDGSIVLQERVVYTALKTENGTYTVEVYKDPAKTNKLETRTNLSESDLSNFSINMDQYSSTAIVEYTFALNGLTCYFNSSRIIM